MTSNTICMTDEIDNVDLTCEDGTSMITLIPPGTPVGTRTIIILRGFTLVERRTVRKAIQDALTDHGKKL